MGMIRETNCYGAQLHFGLSSFRKSRADIFNQIYNINPNMKTAMNHSSSNVSKYYCFKDVDQREKLNLDVATEIDKKINGKSELFMKEKVVNYYKTKIEKHSELVNGKRRIATGCLLLFIE